MSSDFTKKKHVPEHMFLVNELRRVKSEIYPGTNFPSK